MNEIDVTKCEYYNDYYKTCGNFSRLGDDEPYCDPKGFKCSYYISNIEKQLQQLRTDNKKLCTAIRNELPEQYDKRVSEAESDIAWGVLDRNATETEFCKNVIYETRNYIAELQAKNEELRARNSRGTLAFLEEDFKKEQKIEKYKQCLDEIEEILNSYCENMCYGCFDDCVTKEVLQLIKQAKGGENE